MLEYLDLDLLIERRDDHYRARVIDSPAGQASGEFELPFSPLELENFFLRIGQPRTVRRQVRLGAPAYQNIVQEFGGKLYQAVFNDEMRAVLHSSLEVARQERKGLRLRLRLSEAPDLADLPWEYLYNATLNRFLALSVQTSLVRYLDLPERIAPLAVQPPLRMLVMISSPTDAPVLDVEQEWAKLKSSLRGLEERGLLVVDRLPDGQLSTLQRQLRRAPYHILHYIGHAGYDPQGQDGVLLLTDDDGRGRLVSGDNLGVMLHDAPTLRLVVLNACEGARTSRTDPFAGVAQSVVQQGIPAVVAMQFEITDEAAITFAQEFYSALVDAYPVDAALAEARKGILSQGNELEWGTPVLYMRTPEGVLFALDTAASAQPIAADVAAAVARPLTAAVEAPTAEEEARVQRLYADALGAFWLEDWERAIRSFRQVLEARSGFRDAAARLAEAERQARLSALYAEAQAARQTEDWPRAERALNDVAAQQPDYRDTPALLAETRRRGQLASLYAEARQLHEAAQWQAVLNVLARIRALAPDYPDTQGLEEAARAALDRAKREGELDALYTRAQLALGEGRLPDARALLAQVRALDPAYRESAALAARVEQQLAAAEAARRAEQERQAAEQARVEAQRRAEEAARLDAQRSAEEKAEAERQRQEALAQAQERQAAEQAAREEAQRRQEAEAARAAQVAALYAEAKALLHGGEHREALARVDQIRALDPQFADPEEIGTAALRAMERDQEAKRLYQEARGLLTRRQFKRALAAMERLHALDPQLADAEGIEAAAREGMLRRQGRMRGPMARAPGAAAESAAVEPGAGTVAPVAGAAAGGVSVRRGRTTWLALGGAGAVLVIVVLWVILRALVPPPSTTPQSSDPLALDLTPNATMELVAVPAGEFLMGTNTGAGQPGESNEAPQHTVYLDAYYIGQYEVTVEQFAAFVEDTGYQTQAEKEGGAQVWRGGEWLWAEGADWRHPNGPDSQAPAEHPVTQVTWEDAAAFARWAARVTGRPVRLPTEAEWEKAARGDDGRFYPWGSQWEASYANIDETGLGAPADVGSYRDGVSPYGAEDMAGNVWEWVQDWYGEDYYPYAPAQNPTGPADGDQRVVRGGSWYDNQWSVRTAYRHYEGNAVAFSKIGFRIAVGQ